MRSGFTFLGPTLLVFLSGFAGLVYEVLWLKELGLLFGNTAQAAATTLAAFFLGLAGGSRFWGARSPRLTSPLRVYGYIEWAIAISALPYFLLLKLYHFVYEPMYSALGEHAALLTTLKFGLAVMILLPPAFFMGGTFPVMGQYLVRLPNELGRIGSLLYAVNTLGGAVGAFCAAFYLPSALGFGWSYGLAITVNGFVGAGALLLARRHPAGIAFHADRKTGGRGHKKAQPENQLPSSVEPRILAFLSGFLTIGIEVFWTRMFAQVLQNSVYTFSAILVVFLLVLSLGAFLANRLCRLALAPTTGLAALMTLAGVCVAASPFAFMDVTNGMSYLGSGLDWGPYLVTIFTRTVLVLLLPGILIGSIFPYLLRTMEGRGAPGETLGKMTALNTVGAVAGSVAAGFLLLPTMGLWGGLRFLALVYLVLGLVVVSGDSKKVLGLRAMPALGILLLLTALDATQLPLVRYDPKEEQVLKTWQGGHGIVAVVRRHTGSLRIKVNNFYRLGGSAAVQHEQNQALIPLMPHPNPQRVFFLGMGTGITAGASLRLPPVERVVVCELVPEVVDAAALYFSEMTNGLFTDPRVQILRTDGRNHLLGSRERYDAILADLFIPWKQGSGSLYSLDHFEVVRERLRPGGIFVQWIPLYQVSPSGFKTIARTLLHVFPEVLVWRGDFYPEKPILALVASNQPLELDPSVIVERGRALAGNPTLPAEALEAVTIPFYVGNLGRSRSTIPSGPINTDDRPVIEYSAPVSHRRSRSGEASWFVGRPLEAFLNALARATPPRADPYLVQLDDRQRGYVEAGASYYRAALAEREGDHEAARRHRAAFAAKIPIELRPSTDDSQVAVQFGE